MGGSPEGRSKGGTNRHLKHPDLAKEAGSKGGKISARSLHSSEHGKWLASFRENNSETRRKSRRDYGESDTCYQCGNKSDDFLNPFCSWICRTRYRERIQYYRVTYNVDFATAIIMCQAKSTELSIRRITDPHEYIRQGSINRLPYTREYKSSARRISGQIKER